MARLYPFRALRYNTDLVNMADVVTQPYDKITPEMQDRYYAQSPYNLIRIVLGKRKADDTDSENVYTRAADTYKEWREAQILQEEREPALYGYAQTYRVPGTEEVRERRGFIALGHLYDYAERVVFRHEQTFPKHKSDRLALFKAIRAYPEQIYMLYSDPTFTAEHLIFDEENGQPRPADLEITDEYDVVHRVWKLTDVNLIGKLLKSMEDKSLIIADGHHRYETSVVYMQERARELSLEPAASLDGVSRTSGAPEPVGTGHKGEESGMAQLPTPAFPEAAMMMTFVNMEAPGITILPTHRVVLGLPVFEPAQFAKQAERLFTVTEVQPGATQPPAGTLLEVLNETTGPAFIAVTKSATYLLVPRAEAVVASTGDLSARQAQLDVVQLHRLALQGLLGLDDEQVRAGNHVRYLREADEAVAQVRRGEAQVAFLTKPVTLQQMKDISLNLEVMPQKSTDFYPKLLSGLAMYALD